MSFPLSAFSGEGACPSISKQADSPAVPYHFIAATWNSVSTAMQFSKLSQIRYLRLYTENISNVSSWCWIGVKISRLGFLPDNFTAKFWPLLGSLRISTLYISQIDELSEWGNTSCHSFAWTFSTITIETNLWLLWGKSHYNEEDSVTQWNELNSKYIRTWRRKELSAGESSQKEEPAWTERRYIHTVPSEGGTSVNQETYMSRHWLNNRPPGLCMEGKAFSTSDTMTCLAVSWHEKQYCSCQITVVKT